MAVWLLSGPTVVRDVPPEVHPVFIGFGEWYPGVGLLMAIGTDTAWIVSLDGVCRYKR